MAAKIVHQIQVRKPLSHSIKGNGGGTTSKAEWGKITGQITDQTDLVNYINEEIEDINIPTNLSELVNDEGFITKSVTNLDNYYTKQESDSKYLTDSDLNGYAKTTDIPTKVSELQNDADYLTSADLSDYALKSEIPDVPTKVSELENDAHYLSSADMSDYALKTDLNDYVEIDSLTSIGNDTFPNTAGYLTSVDMSDYALKTEIPTSTTQLTNDSGYITSSALSDYALKTDLNDYVEIDSLTSINVSTFINDAHYLSSADLSDYAQKSDLNDYVEIDSLTSINISTFINDSNFIDINALAPYVLTTSLTGINVSTFINNAGYITSSALTPYATITSLSSIDNLNNYYSKTESDSKYLTSADMSNYLTLSSLTTVDLMTFTNNGDQFGDKYATQTWVNGRYAKKTDVNNCYTKSECNDKFVTITSLTSLDVSTFVNNVSYITNDSLTTIDIRKFVNLDDQDRPYYMTLHLFTDTMSTQYYTKTSIDSNFVKITSLSSVDVGTFNNNVGYLTNASMTGVDIRDLINLDDQDRPYYATVQLMTDTLGTQYYSQTYINNHFVTITSLTSLDVSTFVNDANYLTSADLSSYALKSDLADYVTITSLSSVNISTFINDSGYITSSALTPYATISSLSDYVLTSSLTSINISTFLNDSGYITSSVTNLTNYYTKSETYTKSEVDALVQGGGGGGGVATWGSITGIITNQTDLIGISSLTNYYTKTEIDATVGDIDTILQTI